MFDSNLVQNVFFYQTGGSTCSPLIQVHKDLGMLLCSFRVLISVDTQNWQKPTQARQPVTPGPKVGVTGVPYSQFSTRPPGGLTAPRGRSNRVTPSLSRIRSFA
jgi:hypothetical protein